MRENVLYRSIRSLLPDDEMIVAHVHMWRRHRLMVPYVIVAFFGVLAVTLTVGFEEWSSRIGLALGAAALAGMSTTEYRVLVLTTSDLVLMGSSRIRQVATEVVDRLPSTITIKPVGTNLIITDWAVGDQTYSVMRRYQAAMVAISER